MAVQIIKTATSISVVKDGVTETKDIALLREIKRDRGSRIFKLVVTDGVRRSVWRTIDYKDITFPESTSIDELERLLNTYVSPDSGTTRQIDSVTRFIDSACSAYAMGNGSFQVAVDSIWNALGLSPASAELKTVEGFGLLLAITMNEIDGVDTPGSFMIKGEYQPNVVNKNHYRLIILTPGQHPNEIWVLMEYLTVEEGSVVYAPATEEMYNEVSGNFVMTCYKERSTIEFENNGSAPVPYTGLSGGCDVAENAGSIILRFYKRMKLPPAGLFRFFRVAEGQETEDQELFPEDIAKMNFAVTFRFGAPVGTSQSQFYYTYTSNGAYGSIDGGVLATIVRQDLNNLIP